MADFFRGVSAVGYAVILLIVLSGSYKSFLFSYDSRTAHPLLKVVLTVFCLAAIYLQIKKSIGN